MSDDRHIGVLQSCRNWLPTTQHWLHTQIDALPDTVTSEIVCRRTMNLEEFGHSRLHVHDERSIGPPPVDWAIDQLQGLPVIGDSVGNWKQARWTDFRSTLARRREASILHSHFGNTGWQDRVVARRADMEHVVTFYGYDISLLPREEPEWKGRYRELFDEVSLVLCEGPHFAETVARAGCPRDKIRVHHLGVDLEDHPYRPRERDDGEPTRLLMAASFKEKKGFPDALAALGRLTSEFDFELTLIGEAADEERSRRERDRIESTIEQCGLADRIRRLGFVSYDRLIAEMLDHHIFVSPSVESSRGDSEGGAPVSIVAAQATGMPFVGTTHADIPNVVDNGESGLLTDEHDVPGLADHLRDLMANPERWPEMGEHARDRIEREFNADRQGERLAEIYRGLVS